MLRENGDEGAQHADLEGDIGKDHLPKQGIAERAKCTFRIMTMAGDSQVMIRFSSLLDRSCVIVSDSDETDIPPADCHAADARGVAIIDASLSSSWQRATIHANAKESVCSIASSRSTQDGYHVERLYHTGIVLEYYDFAVARERKDKDARSLDVSITDPILCDVRDHVTVPIRFWMS